MSVASNGSNGGGVSSETRSSTTLQKNDENENDAAGLRLTSGIPNGHKRFAANSRALATSDSEYAAAAAPSSSYGGNEDHAPQLTSGLNGPFSVAHSRRSSVSPDQHQKQSTFNPPERPLMTAGTSTTSADLDTQNRHRSISRPPSVESVNSANSVPFAPPPPPAPSSAWKRFINTFSHRVIKRHIKFLVAIYATVLMTLIRRISDSLGPSSYVTAIIVMFIHPARTIGAQLETTLFCIVGGVLAAIWVLPGLAIVAAYNHKYLPEGNQAGWAIDASWFFVGAWIMATYKTRYPKLTSCFYVYTISGIFCLTKNVKIFWPETASEGLGRALNESLDSSRALLNLSTRSFLLNHETIALPRSVVEKAQSEVRNAQKKLFTAYQEARYEVTYSKTNPADYKQVRTILAGLMRHLGSMSVIVQNERLLMLGPLDHDNVDLLAQSGSDSEHDSDITGAENSDESESDRSDGESVRRPGSRQTRASKGEAHNQGDYPGNASAEDAPSRQSSYRRRRHRNREGVENLTSEEGRSIPSLNHQPPRRRNTAELRRVRQLLQRADTTAQTTIEAQQQHHEQLKLEALQHAPQFTHDDIASAPATPSGREVSGFFAHHYRHRSKRTVRSSVTTPNSTRPSSIEGERNIDALKSYRSSLSSRTGLKLKPYRPASLKAGFKFDQGNRQQVRSNERGAGLFADTVLHSTAPVQTDDRVLDDHQPIDRHYHTIHGGSGLRSALTDSQARKAVQEYKKRHDKEIKRSQKRRLRREARAQKNMAREQQQAEAMARSVPPKEVTFGDRKLFMSFLDIVRDPLLRLSDSCSRVMIAMERELVSGLSVEHDRLERIKRRNAQREDAIRAAEAKTTEEGVTAGSHSQEKGLSITRRMHLGRLRALVGLSRHQPTKDEIAYAEALKSGMDLEKDIRHNVPKQDLPDDATRQNQCTPQRNTSLSAIEDDEMDFTLPPNMSYAQYLTRELELFDKAEAHGLRDFIATHPTLDVGPREELFMIFFFLFALREIAREMLRLSKYVEELQEQERQKMEKEGRTKRRRRLWWPKVVGNFWRWFSWGSYSQVKTSEGYDELVMNTTKNLGSRQPRSVEEEKMHIQAKAAAERPVEHHQRRHSEVSPCPKFQERAEQNLETIKRTQVTFELPYQASIDLFNRSDNSMAASADALHSQRGRNESDREDSRVPSRGDPNTSDGHLRKPTLAAQYTVIDIPDFESLQHQNSETSRHFEDINLVNLAPQLNQDYHEADSTAVDSNHDGLRLRTPKGNVGKITDNNGRHQDAMSGSGSQPQRIIGSLSHDRYDTTTKSSTKQRRQQSPPAPEPISTPRPVCVSVDRPETWRYRLWESLQPFKSDEFKFGFKIALAMSFIGLWSWLPWRNNVLFLNDRGQWAMLTIMAIMSPTIGATFSVCAMRIAGTIVGAVWAMLTYLALPGNAFVICAMMLVIAFPAVFLILASPQPKLGIVMMLSYLSITLIKYIGITPDTIYQVCYKRAVTVTIGIIVAVVINSLLWPILARQELRKELANLIGREGMLFAELINKFLLEVPMQGKEPPSLLARPGENQDNGEEYVCDDQCRSNHLERGNTDVDGFQDGFIELAEQESQSERRPQALDRSTEIHRHETISNDVDGIDRDGEVPPHSAHPHFAEDWRNSMDPDRRAFQGVEQQLQTKLIKISELLVVSASEPRLKGPFPMKLYKQIVQCCQNILDRMISMRMAAQSISPEVLELVAGPLNDHRRDMVGALLLYFSVLSSSLASKSPLPPYLPSARLARLRVIYNVREVISAHQILTGEDHYTYIYYYAYSSALEEVIEELDGYGGSEGGRHTMLNIGTSTAGQGAGLHGSSSLQSQHKHDERQQQHLQLQMQVRAQQQRILEQQEQISLLQQQQQHQQPHPDLAYATHANIPVNLAITPIVANPEHTSKPSQSESSPPLD
ncbi:hypothetical protein BGZ99_002235 [Dissophora globulifera]|uniref:Uncharacterized protein n=1 Tax=Dissophora globulifera TaxID=979702 RepID=A0A9P6UWG5_9FUNG|nr:hypothetical protein BGZ99_002235 [Dissophora globulifera]